MVLDHASWRLHATHAARLVSLARSEYEYRHVVLPQHISCHLPQGRLLSEVKSHAYIWPGVWSGTALPLLELPISFGF